MSGLRTHELTSEFKGHGAAKWWKFHPQTEASSTGASKATSTEVSSSGISNSRRNATSDVYKLSKEGVEVSSEVVSEIRHKKVVGSIGKYSNIRYDKTMLPQNQFKAVKEPQDLELLNS